MIPAAILETLTHADDPALRYLALTRLAARPATDADVQAARHAIPTSPRAQALLAPSDRLLAAPYSKWDGAHWVLAVLAEIGYPPGDESLIPLRESELKWLLSREHAKQIRTINGRVRRCASQEAYALWSLLRLGLADERCDELASRLCRWQWPDGGWNCDKRPEVERSSFMETLAPLRALILHGQTTGCAASLAAAGRAAEVFLKRQLFRRQQDGALMDEHFILLHFPCYWHYDILFALKVMAEGGYLTDPRCEPAIALLAARQLPGGGWPADERYYQVTEKPVSGRSSVDWGGVSKTNMNPWVTLDALWVLKQHAQTHLGST